MKNRIWVIGMILMASLFLGACADGTIPANLTENLDGLESVEVDVSSDGISASIDEVEVTGVVSVISDGAWTIAGQSFLLTSETEIKGALEVGDIAKVHAYLGDDGEVFAHEIEPDEDSDDPYPDDDEVSDDGLTELEERPQEIEFVGNVESTGDPTWLISGREFVVNSQTEFKGTITAGMPVKVHASFTDGEGLVAQEIEPTEATDLEENHSDDDNDLKVDGYVESITDEFVVIDGITFYFTDLSEFEDEISVGDYIEVYFRYQGGQNVVREIELGDFEDQNSDVYKSDDDEEDDEYDDFDENDDEDDDVGHENDSHGDSHEEDEHVEEDDD
jgi:hypothetical protein